MTTVTVPAMPPRRGEPTTPTRISSAISAKIARPASIDSRLVEPEALLADHDHAVADEEDAQAQRGEHG